MCLKRDIDRILLFFLTLILLYLKGHITYNQLDKHRNVKCWHIVGVNTVKTELLCWPYSYKFLFSSALSIYNELLNNNLKLILQLHVFLWGVYPNLVFFTLNVCEAKDANKLLTTSLLIYSLMPSITRVSLRSNPVCTLLLKSMWKRDAQAKRKSDLCQQKYTFGMC